MLWELVVCSAITSLPYSLSLLFRPLRGDILFAAICVHNLMLSEFRPPAVRLLGERLKAWTQDLIETEQEIGCKTNKQYCFNCQSGVFRSLDKCMLPSSAVAASCWLGPLLVLGSCRQQGAMELLRHSLKDEGIFSSRLVLGPYSYLVSL